MRALAVKLFVKAHIWIYRVTGGAIGGRLAGLDHLLLSTRGARTGLERVLPLACYVDGERLLVVASNDGSDRNPGWWHNLEAHPEVEVQFGKAKNKMRARTLPPEERAEIWPTMVDYNSFWGRYETMTDRPIPVVELAGSATVA